MSAGGASDPPEGDSPARADPVEAVRCGREGHVPARGPKRRIPSPFVPSVGCLAARRSAPSSRITSPFSISFSMMWRTQVGQTDVTALSVAGTISTKDAAPGVLVRRLPVRARRSRGSFARPARCVGPAGRWRRQRGPRSGEQLPFFRCRGPRVGVEPFHLLSLLGSPLPICHFELGLARHQATDD